MIRLLAVVMMVVTTNVVARTCATADLDYYVSTGGSDVNDGSESSPWATPSWAASWVQGNVDLCGHKVTFHLSGAGCQPFAVHGPFVGARSPAAVVFLGNAVNPSLCPITAPSGSGIALWEGAGITLNGIHVSVPSCASGGTSGITVSDSRLYLAGVWFGPACWAQLQALNFAAVYWISGNVIYTGGAAYSFLSEDKSQVHLNQAAVNFFASVSYSGAFAWADQASVIDFTGTSFIYNGFNVYGRRYVSEQHALIRSGGNQLPGNVEGLVQTYGLVM